MGESQDSQFMKYCRSMDEGVNTSEYFGEEYYWDQIRKIRANKGDDYFWHLWLQEVEYQAKYEGHIIASVHGGTGTMKSLFSCAALTEVGRIFGVPFDVEKNTYINLSDLDVALRDSPFRSSHLKDEQPLTQFGAGSWAEQMSLRDFENTQRKSQRNIFFVAPQLREHQHRFIFQSMDDNIRRMNNIYCEICPPEIKSLCMAKNNEKDFSKKFETLCPPEIELLRGGAVPFYEKEGYPKYCEFTLFTAKNFESSAWPRLVPRGIIKAPMPAPEIVMAYEKIKNANLEKLKSQKDSGHEYLNRLIQSFLDAVGKDKLIRVKGDELKKSVRLAGQIKFITIDNRKFVPESKGVIQSYFFNFTESSRRYTSGQMKIITDMIIKDLLDYCDARNTELKREKDKKRAEEEKGLNQENE